MTTKCYFDDANFLVMNNNEFTVSDDKENPGCVKLTITKNDGDVSEVVVYGSDLVLAIQKCLLMMNDAPAQ